MWGFGQKSPSPGSANKSPQVSDICKECAQKATPNEPPNVGGPREETRAATEGRASGADARERGVVEEEEEEGQEHQEHQEGEQQEQEEEFEIYQDREEDDDDDDEWHTCPGCGYPKPENEFTASSPRCSSCRRGGAESDNGDNRGAAQHPGETPPKLREFREEERIRLLEERMERERREEQGSQRRQEPENQRDPVQEQRRYQSRQIHSVEERMERARREEEGRQREPLQERPSSRSSRMRSSEEGIEREIRYLPSYWLPQPVEDPRPSLEQGLSERRTIYIRSSENSFQETLNTIDRNRALADEFRILLLGTISSPGGEKISQDHGAHIKLVSESEITDLDECLECDETGMEQTAFGQVYFDRDRCRLKTGNGDAEPYDKIPRENHRRWMGYCDWRSAAQIKDRDLPHHKIQPMEDAGEDDAEVGQHNDYLICDTCRTSAHSRLQWEDFPDVESGKDLPEETKWIVRRQEDREIQPQSGPRSRYSGWMHWIMHAWMPVCRRCDIEQKRLHTRGHDGCVCYQNWYLNHWLCQRCDAENLQQYIELTIELKRGKNMRTHAVVGGGLIPNMIPDEGGRRCPCGETPTLRDSETTMEGCQMVKRCGNCLGFIVPKEFEPPGVERISPPSRPPPSAPPRPTSSTPSLPPTSPPTRSPSPSPPPPPSKAARSKRKPRVPKGKQQPTRASKRLRGTQSPGSRLQMLNERGKTADQPIFV